jgi:Bacterial aa3 type cytochrome c oxidase subunit IV
MNIDFDKSHPAVNIDDKRRLYAGFVRASAYAVVLLAALMIGMFIFLT